MNPNDDSPDHAPRGRHLLHDEVLQALHHVTAGLAEPEDRPGQVDMALAVTKALNDEGRLIVQAGTGTGKTIAYLVPAILSEKRTIVSTATKTLQDMGLDKVAHIDGGFGAWKASGAPVAEKAKKG